MRPKGKNNEFKVAVFLTGNAEAAKIIVSGIKVKNAIVLYVGDNETIFPFTAESVYAFELGSRDRLSAGAFVAGAVRLKITEAKYDVLPEIDELAKAFDPDEIRVKTESAGEGIIVTYAYYDAAVAEKFLMELSGTLARADARTVVLCAYDPPAADEEALLVAAEGYNGNTEPPEPDFKFRGYLGAGEKIKLVMQKDVSSGTDETKKIIEKLLLKEKIKWRNVKA